MSKLYSSSVNVFSFFVFIWGKVRAMKRTTRKHVFVSKNLLFKDGLVFCWFWFNLFFFVFFLVITSEFLLFLTIVKDVCLYFNSNKNNGAQFYIETILFFSVLTQINRKERIYFGRYGLKIVYL